MSYILRVLYLAIFSKSRKSRNLVLAKLSETKVLLTLQASIFSPRPPLHAVFPDPNSPGLSRDRLLVDVVSGFLLFQATLPLMVCRRPPKLERPPDQQQTTSLQITRKNGTKIGAPMQLVHELIRFFFSIERHTLKKTT